MTIPFRTKLTTTSDSGGYRVLSSPYDTINADRCLPLRVGGGGVRGNPRRIPFAPLFIFFFCSFTIFRTREAVFFSFFQVLGRVRPRKTSLEEKRRPERGGLASRIFTRARARTVEQIKTHTCDLVRNNTHAYYYYFFSPYNMRFTIRVNR